MLLNVLVVQLGTNQALQFVPPSRQSDGRQRTKKALPDPLDLCFFIPLTQSLSSTSMYDKSSMTHVLNRSLATNVYESSRTYYYSMKPGSQKKTKGKKK